MPTTLRENLRGYLPPKFVCIRRRNHAAHRALPTGASRSNQGKHKHVPSPPFASMESQLAPDGSLSE